MAKPPRRRTNGTNTDKENEIFVFKEVDTKVTNRRPSGPVRELVEHFDFPWQDNECKGNQPFALRLDAKTFAAVKWLIDEKNTQSKHCRKSQNAFFKELIREGLKKALIDHGLNDEDIDMI